MHFLHNLHCRSYSSYYGNHHYKHLGIRLDNTQNKNLYTACSILQNNRLGMFQYNPRNPIGNLCLLSFRLFSL